MRLRLGSLFSGWGGLDMAIEAAFASIGVEVELAWVSDIEQFDKKGHKIGNAPAILAHRHPDVPNLGDITRVDWASVPEVEIVGGGSPCQDVSTAGPRAGMVAGTRSNLWVEMREAIRVLQPTFVIWENVRGSLSAKASSRVESEPGLLGGGLRPGQPALRAFGRVLGDLASLGFDAEWIGLPASDIGAPHGRFREFILAAHPQRLARLEWWQPTARETARGGHSVQLHDVVEHLATDAAHDRPIWAGAARRGGHGPADGGNAAAVGLLPTPAARDGRAAGTPEGFARRSVGHAQPLPEVVAHLLPTPKATNNENRQGGGYGPNLGLALSDVTESAWGPYTAAIARWEATHGPAPAPTKLSKKGNRKLNPEFSSWMMGAPRGWITDVPGITDNQASHAIGNGVVPHQGAAALRILLDRISRWDDQ